MALVYHRLLRTEEAIERAWQALAEGGWPRRDVVELHRAAGHVLSSPVYAVCDSPPFDRSQYDGIAARSADLYGASELRPVKLRVVGSAEVGRAFEGEIREGECVEIATGAPIPRGADCVVMVEYTKRLGDYVLIFRSALPGENIAQAGSDASPGDLLIPAHRLITPREVAALAAQGIPRVEVYRRPSVAVFSTGNELQPPGDKLLPAMVYDVNGPAITSLLKELGYEATFYGILRDEPEQIRRSLAKALYEHDVILTSGSTSAGYGDVIYKVFNELGRPGVLVHGLKLKPGKPTVIAVANGKLLVGLPGFPLSALMVFHTVALPLLSRMSGLREQQARSVKARFAYTLEAGRGKRELVPVQLLRGKQGLAAYPLFASSGSATALARADGFVDVHESKEMLLEGEEVDVYLLSSELRASGLSIVGSHCPALDLLLEELAQLEPKVLYLGSVAGLEALARGECDIAGLHLLDKTSGQYNLPFIRERLGERGAMITGYARRIGFVVAKGNPKRITSFRDLLRPDVAFVNRPRGSGIRALVDLRLEQLFGRDPASLGIRGYHYQVNSHTAVAAAVCLGRADVGVAVEAVRTFYEVDFIPLAEERFDFATTMEALDRPEVGRFMEAIKGRNFWDRVRSRLPGIRPLPDTGSIVYPT